MNTEYLLLKLADIAAQAGIYSQTPIYRRVIKQIEIVGNASNLLTKQYYADIKKLEDDMNKKVQELNIGINPAIKKSKLNMNRRSQIEMIQREYIENWHKILFEYLKSKFYQIYAVDRVGKVGK